MSRDDAYLLDMLNGARKLVRRYASLSRQEFGASSEKQDGAFWVICTIGEAATHVSDGFRAEHPEIPWSQIIGTRNVLIHGYDRINLDKVWHVIIASAPALVDALSALVPGRDLFE